MHNFNLPLLFFIIICCTTPSNCTFQSFLSHQHNKQYLYEELAIPKNYGSMKQYCEANNASLVQITSFKEGQWIKKNIHPKLYFFMGAETVDGSEGTKVPSHFLDGSPIGWFNWRNNYPNGRYPCSVIVIQSSDMTWLVTSCDTNYEVVMCERSVFEYCAVQLEKIDDQVKKYRKEIAVLVKQNEDLKKIVENNGNGNVEKLPEAVYSILSSVIERLRALIKGS